jgi:WXG100 family type VII secretion target
VSDEILLKASDAQAAANKVQAAAANATSDFNSLKSELSSLADYFRGRTATAFDARYQEWHTSAVQLSEALDGLGKFLSSAAAAIEDVDTQLQSQLGG